MKLQFSSTYKSITEKERATIESLQLSDLNIITGVNGSGKTHLLQALINRHINIPNFSMELFNFQNFKFESNDHAHINNDMVSSKMGPKRLLTIIETRLGIDIPKSMISESEVKEYHSVLAELMIELNQLLIFTSKEKLPYSSYKAKAKEFLDVFFAKIPKKIQIDRDEVVDFYQNPSSFVPLAVEDKNGIIEQFNKYDFFSDTAMGQTLLEHIAEYKKNQKDHYMESLGKAMINNEGVTIIPFDEQQNPIDEFNELLKEINGISFSLESTNADSISIKIKHNDARIKPDDLSSGEQVLLGLATFLYDRKMRNQGSYVLLLDEVDTSLHPSMIRSLFDVITGNFIKQHDIKVIMVTHSPTTIAEAPEAATLFAMNRLGEHRKRIEQVCKNTALRVLSEGFVSITHEESEYELTYRVQQAGKPVLFVEGMTDEMILSTAWKKLNPNSDDMPFLIVNSYDAYAIQNKFNRAEIFGKSPNTIFIGLVDFDEAGKECWKKLKSLKKYDLVDEDLHVLKYSEQSAVGEGYFTLLPVPTCREKIAGLELPGSCLTIELLFPDEIVRPYSKEEKVAGEGKMLKVKEDKKTDFAEKIERLEQDKFENFKPLFKMIQNIIDGKYK